jgi:hypothetical protein
MMTSPRLQTYDAPATAPMRRQSLTILQKSEVKSASPEPAPKLTKAERRAQHQQLQKQLWDSAENPSRNHWLEAQGVVPLKQEFKPPMTVLSRKPAPTIAKRDPATGVSNLSLEDDGEDSEEEARKKREAVSEERQRVAKLEREEKQRIYDEARMRIFGTSAESSQGRDKTRRGRGGKNSNRNSRPASKDTSPTRTPPPGQLFDPNDVGHRMPKPTTPNQDGPVRQPRGPDSNGRGGFGFARRGNEATA